MKLSNKFTLSRVLFAPVFFILYYVPIWTGNFEKLSAFLMIPLLIVFQFTDFLDGYYARKKNEVSDFGKLFDPFADVMLNLTIFFCALNSVNKELGAYMPIVILLLILYREFSMTFLRMISVSKGVAIAARKGGKFKTVFYITTAFFVLVCESAMRLGFDLNAYLPQIKITSLVLFIICLILSYASFLDYIKNFASVLKK